MSLFLDSNGYHTDLVQDIKYSLVAVTSNTTRVRTSDASTDINRLGSGPQYIKIFGENVFSYPVEHKSLIYWYVDLSDISFIQPKIAAYVGGMLTGNLRGYVSGGMSSYYDEMRHIGKIAEERHKTSSYTYTLKKEKQKISQNHHYHVRLYDLYKRTDFVTVTGPEVILLKALDKFNNIEITHTTFITYFRSVTDKIRQIFLGMIIVNGGLNMDWLKEEGKASKQSSYMIGDQSAQLYELNVLVNRIDTPVDWQLEKHNREEPQLARVAPHDVYKHAITLFTLGLREGKKPLKMSYEEYWRQRAVAMPAGAIHDEDPEILAIIKTLPREVRNKKGLASALPYLQQEYFLCKPREIHSYASTKYEWGKSRALYGCDFTSHVHADFGMLACEETFPFFVPTGTNANANFIAKTMAPYKGYIPLCYDYEDFNSQHSFSNMQQVIRAWRDVYGKYLSDEQLLSLQWTHDSIKYQHVHNRSYDQEYMTEGTLFSGWRLTAFMNTALNYCYLAQAGINKSTLLHLHNGDDVFATIKNLQQSLVLYNEAKSLGIRANMTKMSIGTIAEFLRTDMRSKKANDKQYLARGISTFTHSRIESGAPASYRNVLESYVTRYKEVISRGGDRNFLNKLYRKQLFYARKLFNVELEIQQKMLTYDRVNGGLIDGGIIENEQLVEKSLYSKTLTELELKDYINNGVNDYTTYIASQFPNFRNEITKNSVYNSILNSYNVNMKTIVVEEADIDEKRHMRAMKGAWSKMAGIALINRLRMGVSNIMVVLNAISTERARSLEKASDPIAWLAILLK